MQHLTTGTAIPTIDRERAEQADEAREHSTPGSCPVFRDCTEVEPGHYDHSAHHLKVTEDDGITPVLTAGMVALSGEVHAEDRHAIVYLRNAEFTDAASVRAKTAELRSFLDQVDAMADRVFADHQGRG